MKISEEFLSPYDHIKTEKKIYKLWEDSGYFNPDNLKQEGESYTIIMPPPNANGNLHAGHALFVTLEDTMIRFARMQGKKALWLPGADHAGFETQVVYEKKLEKEGRSRFQMSKDELYKEILDFTLSNKKNTENQIKSLGASCDWSRTTFTLEDRVKDEVYKTFKKLEEDKLLYRGLRSVHWCPKHQTGFSEVELNHEERKDPFYYFQYGPFVIGTVRPETKFADKYIVVHPDDERYSQYKHGQTFEVEWINGPIKATLIKDEAGNPDIGSGAMTITPWHSAVDYEIAQKHNLEIEQIIDEKGKLLPVAGEFEGMNISEARPKIVEKLKEKGLLTKVDEDYVHTVPTCYKCGRDIEPQLKDQWFIKMKPLADKAIDAIKKEKVNFVTKKYKKIALHWLNNIQDWNISRQIVWGISIPAKICKKCSKGFVDMEDNIKSCDSCDCVLEKDTDTFDTWFSSGQWPFVTLGFGSDDKEYKETYKKYYPTSVMETGHDILFFWVLRMIMLGIYRTGEVPFKDVYLHGLVRDKKGQKMSKSKGNVINPLEVTEKFGTDSLRMAYLVGNVPGESINFDEEKIRGYKKFSNKLWNITRFVFENTDNVENISICNSKDKKHIKEIDNLLEEITKEMEEYKYHLVTEKIYHYTWHVFADKIIEYSKKVLEEGSEDEKKSVRAMLMYIHTRVLIALHPFMPFITEEIWQHIPKNIYKEEDFLLINPWPVKKKSFFKKLFTFM